MNVALSKKNIPYIPIPKCFFFLLFLTCFFCVGKCSLDTLLLRHKNLQMETGDKRHELTSLAVEMMNIESISGNEGNMAQYLKEVLEFRGWKVHLQPVIDGGTDVKRTAQSPTGFSSFSSGTPRCNVFACRPQESACMPRRLLDGPRVLLNSHMDTVPPFISPRVQDGMIYGRGSCDAKGIIAAQIVAADRLIAEGLDDVGLLFVVGEETDHSGMSTANQLGLNPEYLIVGEPTRGKMISLQKGILKMQLRTEGVACHSGYPEIGHSAINDMIDILHELKGADWPSSEELGATTLNIGLINGGQAANALAEKCEATLMFRVTEDPLRLKELVQKIIGRRGNLMVISQNSPVHLHTCAGYTTDVASFNTDIAYFKFSGKSILLGPGDILDAHSQHEKISIAELEDASEMYYTLIKSLLRGDLVAGENVEDGQVLHR